MTLLVLRGVTRVFGPIVANDAVDLEVDAGEVVGLLGANGAGKTTAIRLGLGLLSPDSGRVEQFGAPPTLAARRRIGYVPQGLGLWSDLTVNENLAFMSGAFGREPAALGEDLVAVRDDVVGGLSLGLRRRVAFVAALGHDPDLLVLDEPTSGVDVLAASRLWERIRATGDAGTGVLVSTHSMAEARQCDRLVVLAAGRVVAAGSESEIVAGRSAVSVVASSWSHAFEALDAAGLDVSLAGSVVRVLDSDEASVMAVLRAAGVQAELTSVPATLEETLVSLARR